MRTADSDRGPQRIGAEAFFDCALLEKLEVPASVEWIGENAFEDSGLQQLTVYGTNLLNFPDALTCTPDDLVLIVPDIPIGCLPESCQVKAARGFLTLYRQGHAFPPELEESGLRTVAAHLEQLRDVPGLWDLLPVLLQRRLFSLSEAQTLVEQTARWQLPEQTAAVLQYIHTCFSREDLEAPLELPPL